jgi:hypothetical protein
MLSNEQKKDVLKIGTNIRYAFYVASILNKIFRTLLYSWTSDDRKCRRCNMHDNLHTSKAIVFYFSTSRTKRVAWIANQRLHTCTPSTTENAVCDVEVEHQETP